MLLLGFDFLLKGLKVVIRFLVMTKIDVSDEISIGPFTKFGSP